MPRAAGQRADAAALSPAQNEDSRRAARRPASAATARRAGVVNNAGISLEALRWLDTQPGRECLHAVLTQLGQTPRLAVQQVTALRRTWSQEQVQAAIAIAQCQLAAMGPGGKFAELGQTALWAVPEALEQSTSYAVALHKAGRFKLLNLDAPVIDFCAGIGGDALGLAALMPVIAVERDAVRAELLRRNLAALQQSTCVVQADVDDIFYQAGSLCAFHIDPVRRDSGRRLTEWAEIIPGPAVLTRLINSFAAGAIKLSPAVDFESLPPGHVELISDNGVTVQAVLWTGRLADMLGMGKRTATVLRHGHDTWSFTDTHKPVTAQVLPSRFIFEVDGAVTRAGLAWRFTAGGASAVGSAGGETSLKALTVDGGYLTGEQSLTHPALTCFEVIDCLAFDVTRVSVRLATPAEPCGKTAPINVEVKKRGRLDINTDELQRRWQKAAMFSCAVLIFRAAHGGVVAAITRRIPPS